MAYVEADVILMATGRKPRTEGLNLEALGITLAPNGAIPVDDNFQIATVPDGSSIVLPIIIPMIPIGFRTKYIRLPFNVP